MKLYPYFVSKDFTSFLIDCEFRSLLVGLLDDRVLDLSVDTFVGIGSLDINNRTPIRNPFFDLKTVGAALGENELFIVDIDN